MGSSPLVPDCWYGIAARAELTARPVTVLIGALAPPFAVLPQALTLPSIFWATNELLLEKTEVKPAPVAALPAGCLFVPAPPKVELPHEKSVPSFLSAVNACSLE